MLPHSRLLLVMSSCGDSFPGNDSSPLGDKSVPPYPKIYSPSKRTVRDFLEYDDDNDAEEDDDDEEEDNNEDDAPQVRRKTQNANKSD